MAGERINRHPSTRFPEPSHILTHSPMIRVERDGKKILANPKHNSLKPGEGSPENPNEQEKSV